MEMEILHYCTNLRLKLVEKIRTSSLSIIFTQTLLPTFSYSIVEVYATFKVAEMLLKAMSLRLGM